MPALQCEQIIKILDQIVDDYFARIPNTNY